MSNDKLPTRSSPGDIDAFLRQAAALPAHSRTDGRLIFALDATASREQLWDRASQIQARMFEEAGKVGRLQIQLCYYRGNQEFRAQPWTGDTRALAHRMGGLRCRAELGRPTAERLDGSFLRSTLPPVGSSCGIVPARSRRGCSKKRGKWAGCRSSYATIGVIRSFGPSPGLAIPGRWPTGWETSGVGP